MLSSVQALLAGIVDYAGLFPPAQLPMEQSVRNYVGYRSEREEWMLGRFICPAARLAELSSFRDVFSAPAQPLIISALGRGGKDVQGFLAGLTQDLEDIAVFRKAHGERVEIDVYETKLPADLFDSSAPNDKVAKLLEQARQMIEAAGPPSLTPFYETMPSGADWLVPVEMTVAAIAACRSNQQTQRCQPAGFKLRCGGADASAFPSSSQIVAVLSACREAKVPLKFTAGLHHPLRHYDDLLRTPMHGFLNLFIAGILAGQIDTEQMQQIVEDTTSDHFFFNQEGLGWKDVRVPLSVIEQARKDSVISFGSCSFDEPRDDLRQLGLI